MVDKSMTKEEYYEELFTFVKNGERDLFRERFLTLHERDQQ